MKVAVYTVALNEEQFVSRWYESARDADYILIADTGSTDRTIEFAEQLDINTISISVSPWRFDDARNAALAALPSDIDMCISLDMDEVLAPGWREPLEEAWSRGVTRPTYKHVWSWKEDGTPGLEFGYDHIHARKGYRWRHPVHEALYPYNIEEKREWVDGIETHHHPDPTKSRSQYLPLLKLSVDEDPHNDRNAYYYARELFFHGELKLAVNEFKRYLDLPTARWAAERAAAYRYLAKCDPDRAEQWLLYAVSEDPSRRESLVSLSLWYYEQSYWEASLDYARNALRIVDKPMDYLCEEYAWGELAYDLASIASWNLGYKESALDYCDKALHFAPNDARLQENFAQMVREMFPAKITAVIPTKSNVEGATKVIEVLEQDPQVEEIVVVLDGDKAVERYADVLKKYSKVSSFRVDEAVGIHAMWNVGIEQARKLDTHAVFINDDLIPKELSAGTLSSLLEWNPSIGLVCPSYEDRQFHSGVYESVRNARGTYNNVTGIAGCFMALSRDLVHEFMFDESMKWYFGDDDVVHWVNNINRKTCITSVTSFEGNDSFTTVNDMPDNFWEDTENDRKIFESKWMN